MEEKKPDYVFILVSVGQPQMQSNPIDGYGPPPERIKQGLGWYHEKEGFGYRMFELEKGKHKFHDSQKEVLVYRERTPNPTLGYMGLDFRYLEGGLWETPTERNVKAALDQPASEKGE